MSNPILDREPDVSLRDPAAVFSNGVWHCFHTAVEHRNGRYSLFVDTVTSRDLVHWSVSRRLTEPGLDFSSPGNVIRFEGRWVLCLQSYPIKPGALYGGEDSRLWLMDSDDLVQWTEPRLLQPLGCTATWSPSRRQIDPYLVTHAGQFWCFYKTAGQIGLLVSPDLHEWREASPSRPVLSAAETLDGSTVENPCVIQDSDGFVLFFSPCRPGRGIGVARSSDLIHWHEVHYLDFPPLPWAEGGPTAAMVVDTRADLGHWTMFFHGERAGHHSAALGVAWSDDLEHWHCPD